MDIHKDNVKFKKADQTSNQLGGFGLIYLKNHPKQSKLENNFPMLHEEKINGKR